MFDYIFGLVVEKNPSSVIIETNGIGYKIHIPLSTYERTTEKLDAKIFTKLFIKEDEIKIYGFSSREERALFDLLLSVNSVGPNMALTILSGSSVRQFKDMVLGNDLRTLQKIKGIGKKTAERIILELRETIQVVVPGEVSSVEMEKRGVVSDAIMALIALGYTRGVAEKAVKSVSENFDVSDGVGLLIKESLKKV
ncbi:MAG: Holliday junction branch migration protein RuvA [Candidatus Scalindua sp. AMX11]|nr:MAG: Holliday junction branch migration protein RuvA [Candidatus Scalindua sp.]NOG86112.1 Holliday junction branch migration protein RuvA [Planctomycetota bacterium]RZV98879.1 MAG: Holliday junction branch migration protein RuvA [Candidatus Scalindua sp. SCAELEC01]TDE66929.1 MAG: Holliday junction branch migration protein RuvA [Candidatus Scalindua sp. AMX11]GJQ57736.1 MAG: Holliday junction ATP-dependent DNA helicase RuvA [Candidatus Scalindua sp.]